MTCLFGKEQQEEKLFCWKIQEIEKFEYSIVLYSVYPIYTTSTIRIQNQSTIHIQSGKEDQGSASILNLWMHGELKCVGTFHFQQKNKRGHRANWEMLP
jgi:hypothetical protein